MTKKEHEAALAKKQQEIDVLHATMSAAIRGEVQWIRGKAGYRLGLVRLTSPTGGFVIVDWAGKGQTAIASAYYLDDYVSDMRRVQAAGLNGPEYAAQYELVEKALAMRRAELDKNYEVQARALTPGNS